MSDLHGKAGGVILAVVGWICLEIIVTIMHVYAMKKAFKCPFQPGGLKETQTA